MYIQYGQCTLKVHNDVYLCCLCANGTGSRLLDKQVCVCVRAVIHIQYVHMDVLGVEELVGIRGDRT